MYALLTATAGLVHPAAVCIHRRAAIFAAAASVPCAAFGAASAAAALPTASVDSAGRVLLDVAWEPAPPYTREDFRRLDESNDFDFYDEPKLVQHIDEKAVQAAVGYHTRLFKDVAKARYGEEAAAVDVLDLCSSWVSHYPTDRRFGRVVGLGMNAKELELNPQLTERTLRDLNKEPKLPYEDQSFDAITCTVSIDYLTAPLKVVAEAARVLRPGGTLALVISNRLFFSKAVALWTGKDDDEHIYTVGGYIHYGSPLLTEPSAVDLRPARGKKDDPLYAIFATRRAA